MKGTSCIKKERETILREQQNGAAMKIITYFEMKKKRKMLHL